VSWRRKSYEVLPALSVRRANLRKAFRTITIAWMFGVVWQSCASGSHVKSFARMLGFNDFAFGLMGAIPFLATFGQLIATILIERTGLRKYQFLQCMTLHRLSWLVIAAIPLLVAPPSWLAVAMMLGTLGVGWFMAALATPAYYSWMGDLIPRRIRGRYMATRFRFASVVQIFVVIAIGVILDAVTVKGSPETAQSQGRLMTVASVIFCVAAVFGAIDVLLFRRIREVIPSTPDKPRAPAVDIRVPGPAGRGPLHLLTYAGRYVVAAFGQVLVDPLRDRAFRHYVGFGMVMTFAMTAGGWYYWLNSLEYLHFSKLGTNVLFLVIGPLAGIAALKGWGKLVDRWGRRPVLLIAGVGVVFSVVPWFFATPTTPYPQFVASAVNCLCRSIGGLFGHEFTLIGPETPVGAYMLGAVGCLLGSACWRGIALAQTGVILGFSDGPGRSKYVAASAVLISMGGVAGGLAAGVLTQSLRSIHYLEGTPIGPFQWNNWHAAFALSLLARIGGVALLIRMPDPGAGRVRDLVRLMGTNAYNAVAPRLFYPLRIVGWRRRNNRRHNETK